jgi:hypothetical protein
LLIIWLLQVVVEVENLVVVAAVVVIAHQPVKILLFQRHIRLR